MIIGENGIFEQAKWGSFSSRFADVQEIRNMYEASKEMEEIQSQIKLSVEEKKGLTGEVTKEEKEEIEKNNKTLKTKMEELSGKPIEELKIYWIENKKIKIQNKRKICNRCRNKPNISIQRRKNLRKNMAYPR